MKKAPRKLTQAGNSMQNIGKGLCGLGCGAVLAAILAFVLYIILTG